MPTLASPTIPALLHRAVREHPDKEYVVLDDRRLTYRALEAASTELATGLLANGVGKGTRVGVLFPNGPDWAVSFFAAARIGALVVPLSTYSTPAELVRTLRHADVHTLLMVDRFLAHDYVAALQAELPGLDPSAPFITHVGVPYLRHLWVWDRATHARRASPDRPAALSAELVTAAESEVTPADQLVVMYTSGSTGEPKGVVHTHGAIVRQAAAIAAHSQLTAADRLYAPMPFFWMGGLTVILLATAHVGGTVLCQEVFEPGSTLELLERERATWVLGWPASNKAMADHPSFATRDLSSIRGGSFTAALPPELRPPEPTLRHNSLGMTETCGPHTWGDVPPVTLPERLRGSFGYPVPGMEHKIVDPETGVTLPDGEEGELCVRGRNLMQGIYKREREQTFDADGWYHTGDHGYFREGQLFFTGRRDDLIKTGGANIAAPEVEAALERLEGVKNAFVVGLPDPVRGQRVAAAIVPARGATVDPARLLIRLKEQLAAYKVPRDLVVLAEEEIPFLTSGKVDKRALTRLLEARVD